ncbi:MAG: uridine diphosphate-N-acetylglucosamine-binding protein YvcK [Candidatus Omnitrophica bacterium]|nr:uridine diphosphate-N-acetylglucosamine-binding protein YvcK [Candidatus Omnitrophota bacterium]
MQKNILIIAHSGAEETIGICLNLNFYVEVSDGIDLASEGKFDLVIFDTDGFTAERDKDRRLVFEFLYGRNAEFIVLSSQNDIQAVNQARHYGARDFILKPYNYREFILHLLAVVNRRIRISCIGGGTGLFSLLLGLKTLPQILLTSIVNMSDDGGSSGKLRASFGILPPGDVRRSLVALSNAPVLMNEVMQHRFTKGEEFVGHSFGNLFLTALTEIKGSMPEAVKAMGDILNIQGVVLPVTDTETTLCAEFSDGLQVKGESKIDITEGRCPDLPIKRIWHEPAVQCGADVYSAIINADFVIIGPGDLFTSVATNLLVKGISEAIINTSAKKIYVCNLMTEPGETANFDAYNHIREIVTYLGGDYLDYVVISNTKLTPRAIEEYAKKKQNPVEIGKLEKIARLTQAKIILADVGHEEELVRHDSDKLRNEIGKIIKP